MTFLVGISCCTKLFSIFGMPNHAASDTYVRAVDDAVGHSASVLIPANGARADIGTLLSRLDGIILTGSRSNVHPAYYNGPPHPEGTWEDEGRDATTLPLIRAAIAAGTPLLAICRGMQEMNVAMGGSLHQRLQDLPGRMDHSTPMHPSHRLRTGKAHLAHLISGSWLHGLAGATDIAINSLHNQGVDRLAQGLAVQALAPDGTIEAVRTTPEAGGPRGAYAVGVQWHPEYDWPTDAVSLRIFQSFGAAMAARADEAARAVAGYALAAD